MKCTLPLALALTVAGCTEQRPQVADLPRQSDRWVDSVSLNADSIAEYIAKTETVGPAKASQVKPIVIQSIRIGDEVNGVLIGAIRCSFYWTDAFYRNEQYMWRGRWGCEAGRSRDEVINAVGDDGLKRFEYISVRPVSLN